MLSCRNISLMRGRNVVLADVSLTFEQGTVTVFAGPNGAGKSTLLECLAGELEPSSGAVLLDGLPFAMQGLDQRARRRVILQQDATIAFDFSVADVVAMGLHPHGILARSARGASLVHAALAEMELFDLAHRAATRLSGGEQQRVHIARCLVQVRAGLGDDGAILLLDEPTSGLDYRHQYELARVLRALAGSGVTIILSLHDLPLAQKLAHRIVMLGNGMIASDGPPNGITPKHVANIYRIQMSEAGALVGQPAGHLLASALAAE